jgi:uncharacterized protein YxeA
MDKFLIDPPDNITIDKVVVPQENETIEYTGPSPLQPEPISIEDISVPQETSYVETGPPSSVIKESIEEEPIIESIDFKILSSPSEEPIDKSLTGETLFPVIKESIEEPVKFSLFRWILWILILVLFIVLALYYAIKYALNESGYIIKKNAKEYKVSLDEMKSDIKNWLRGWVEGIQDWNENLASKTNQFFFRQHVDKGTFKSTKYKIPKNLISPLVNKNTEPKE